MKIRIVKISQDTERPERHAMFLKLRDGSGREISWDIPSHELTRHEAVKFFDGIRNDVRLELLNEPKPEW